MQKYILNSFAAALICLLAGCQARTLSVGQVFNGYPSSNHNLVQTVQDALNQSEDPQIAQVQATMNQGTLVLSGYVKKIRQSDTAEQIARQVSGLQSIENHIIVKP